MSNNQNLPKIEALQRSLELQKTALTRTARRFKRVLAHAGDLVLHIRADASVERIVLDAGRLPPVLEEENLFEYLHEMNHLALRQWLQVAQNSDAPQPLVCRTNSVPPVWLELAGSAMPDAAPGDTLVSARNITAWKDNEEKLSALAAHDPLTGLPNRSQLQIKIREALARLKRIGEGFALLMLDLDGFKRINDSMGHPAGDALLQAVSTRLRESLREIDMVARTGGDEFVCLLPGIVLGAEAATVAQRILGTLRQPFVVQNQSLHVSASIGITLCPTHGDDEVSLTKYADAAMYQSKEKGKNRYAVYTEDLSPAAERGLRLESAMHDALKQGEFSLAYQPIVHADGTLAGCEALMRWTTPDGAQISPTEFIPIAESTGLISILGHWALKTACMQLSKWADSLPPGFYVSVNVSPRQFRSHNFLNTVDQALDLSGLSPERLMLEITEGVLMENPAYAVKTLRQLSKAGVTISVDDFGTGYSSLAYLKTFALNVLKLDRSFVKDLATSPKDLAIAGAVISLARELGLKVVAEGVEHEAQLNLLKERACALYQGWLFGKAEAPDVFKQRHLDQ